MSRVKHESPSVQSNNYRSVIAFDFDNTVVNGHFHEECRKSHYTFTHSKEGTHLLYIDQGGEVAYGKGYTYEKVLSDPTIIEYSERLLQDENKGIKNPWHFKATIEALQAEGHRIAITSFSCYPDTIIKTCKYLGLRDIDIVTGFPTLNPIEGEPQNLKDINTFKLIEAMQVKGKGDHIRLVMHKYGFEDYSKATLVDDSDSNIAKARELGMSTIWADPNDPYALHLNKLIHHIGMSAGADFTLNPENIEHVEHLAPKFKLTKDYSVCVSYANALEKILKHCINIDTGARANIKEFTYLDFMKTIQASIALQNNPSESASPSPAIEGDTAATSSSASLEYKPDDHTTVQEETKVVEAGSAHECS